MSKLLLFCTVTCLFALCCSIEDKPGYCSYEGIYIKEGERSPSHLGSCQTIKCDSASPTSISALGCGVFQPRPGCHESREDNTKLYPDCCPVEIC